MKNLLNIFAILLLAGSSAVGQGLDPTFSLFNEQQSFLNPALVGNFQHKWQVSVGARDSYYAVSSPFRTANINLDINLPINAWSGNIWGVGFRVLNDNMGDAGLRHTRFNGIFSIGQYLDARQNHSISVGFEGSYGNRRIGYDEVYWGSQWQGEGFDLDIDPGEPLIQEAKGYIDLSTGLQYTYRGEGLVDARAGIAVHHALRPDVSLYLDPAPFQFDRRFTVHGDMEYRITDYSFFRIRPSFVFFRQGLSNNIVLGNDFVFMLKQGTRTTGKRKESSMSFGLYHRWMTDVIPTFKLNLAGFTFGAAYDVTVANTLRNEALTGYYGSIEFFISYKAGFQKGFLNSYQRYRTGL